MKIKQILTFSTILATLLAMLFVPMTASAKGKPDRAILLKDANGVEIGRVIGMETVSWPYVMTKQGYRTLFRLGTGMIYAGAPLYFKSIDCTGQVYVGARSPGTVFMPNLDDDANYTAGAIYYSPNDEQASEVDLNSRLADGVCLDYIVTRDDLYPAEPNKPEITGIENTAYPTRMLIE
jgi:hypothetical protein